MNIRRTITVITMACGGVLALTPPAAATPSSFGALVPSTFVEVYNSADVPESSVQSATVPCPAGMAVVSTGGGGSELDSITPGADYASGVTTTRAERGERDDIVVAQATCAPIAQFAGTSVATSREQYRHSVLGEWTQTITCAAGMRAFAGGGYFKTNAGAISKDGYFMYANTPTLDGRGWTVSAMDQTFTDRLVVTTRCAPSVELYPPGRRDIPHRPGAWNKRRASQWLRALPSRLPADIRWSPGHAGRTRVIGTDALRVVGIGAEWPDRLVRQRQFRRRALAASCRRPVRALALAIDLTPPSAATRRFGS